MKALFTYNYGLKKMDYIRSLGIDVIIRNEKELVYDDELSDVDILICYDPFKTLDIKKMKKLKLIILSSIGVDQAPLEFIKKQGILLCNNKGGYSIPIGEWIVLKILEMVKQSKKIYKNQDNRQWIMEKDIFEVFGKTITFVGTGSLAKEAAKRLQGFECNILGVNTTGHKEKFFNKCYDIDSINCVLKDSDVVVITMPYTGNTHNMVNKSFIENMKDKSYFINVSRGNIVDEKELVKALKSGKVAMAALDVFKEEPLNHNSELWDVDNLIITCHNSWMSDMKNERRYKSICDNLKRFLKNEPLLTKVNLERGY